MPEENVNPGWAAQTSQTSQWSWSQSGSDFVLSFWEEKSTDTQNADNVNWLEGLEDVAETTEPITDSNQWGFDISFGESEASSAAETLDVNTEISIPDQESVEWGSVSDFNLNLSEDTSLSQVDDSMETIPSETTSDSEETTSVPENTQIPEVTSTSEDVLITDFSQDSESVWDVEVPSDSEIPSVLEDTWSSEFLSTPEDTLIPEDTISEQVDSPSLDGSISPEPQEFLDSVDSQEFDLSPVEEISDESNIGSISESDSEMAVENSDETQQESVNDQNLFAWSEVDFTESDVNLWNDEPDALKDAVNNDNVDITPDNADITLDDVDNQTMNIEIGANGDSVLEQWEPQEYGHSQSNLNDLMENAITTENSDIPLDKVENDVNIAPEFVEKQEAESTSVPLDVAPEMVMDYSSDSQVVAENIEPEPVVNSSENVATINMDAPLSEWVEDQEPITQVQSTLSLDQILDSEILSQPEFADNSVAVPNNIVESTWLFANKKIVAALVWVGIFLLVWFVASLAFPSASSDRKPNEVVDTWDVTFPPEDVWESGEHWVSEESPIVTETENPLFPTIEEIGTISSGWGLERPQWWATSTVVFPEVDEWWDSEEYLRPSLYTWGDVYEENETEKKVLAVDEIMSVISSFKSQAESYYSLWQENQDRYLIKYATQIKYLCNNYEQRVNSGEWLDSDSLSEFRNEVNEALSKINLHNNGWESIEVVQSQNLSDESYFPDKDELTAYIYNR